MADIRNSLPILFDLEYDNNPKLALEQVPGEDFLTYKGITKKYHPDWKGWDGILNLLDTNKGDKKKTGQILEADPLIQGYVFQHYKLEFWDKARLDEIESQHKAVYAFNTPF